MPILPKYRTTNPDELVMVDCSHEQMVIALTRLYEVMRHMDDVEARMDDVLDEMWEYQDKDKSVPDKLSKEKMELGILIKALADERQNRFMQIGYVFALDVLIPHVRKLEIVKRAEQLAMESAQRKLLLMQATGGDDEIDCIHWFDQ